MRPKTAIIIFCFFVIIQNVHGINKPPDSTQSVKKVKRERWYLPHYVPVQYAGNIGFISTGIGYIARKDNYQLSLLYGYTPKSVASVTIHAITAKNIFHIYRFPVGEKHTLLPYAALGVSLEIGGRSFFTLPSNMPKGYYDFPKSIHVVAAGGLKLRYATKQKFFHTIEFFGEMTTIDAYIWYKFLSDDVRLPQIISLSFGVNLIRK